jgi:hypothetical protein
MFVRSLSSGRMLIAAAAVCILSMSAKADLTLSIFQGTSTTAFYTQVVSGGNTIAPFTINTTGTVNATGGYSFSGLTVSATQGSSPFSEQIRLSGTLNATNSASEQFRILLFSSTAFTNAAGASSGILTQLLSTTYAGDESRVGTSMTAIGAIGNSLAPPPITTATVGVNSSTPSGSDSSAASGVNASFYMAQQNNQLTIGRTGSLGFTSTTIYAVPEPASIMAALMGLPCMGMVVGLVRRRLTGAGDVVDLGAIA